MAIGRDRYNAALCNRIYYGAGTAGPFTLARLLGLASDLDGHMRTSRALVPVKTAMEKEQVRERERSRRKTQCSGPFTRKMSSYWTPYPWRLAMGWPTRHSSRKVSIQPYTDHSVSDRRNRT